MVYRVEITESGKRDLTDAFRWAFGDAHDVRAAWVDELQDAVLSLGQLPYRCPLAGRSDRSIRVLFVGKRPHVYRVLYRIDESKKVVKILHVRHGSRKDQKLK